MKWWLGTAAALFALHAASVGSALAQFTETDTASLTVSLEVTAECSITNSPSINFGSAGLLSSDIDEEGTITVQCTNGTPYAIALGEGGGADATVVTRKMTRSEGTETVSYTLFSDSSRESVWGETLETDVVEATGDGSAQDHIIYGRVLSQGTAPVPGSYNDTVAVTLHY